MPQAQFQGNLNRLNASLQVSNAQNPNSPVVGLNSNAGNLNINSSSLGPEGISLTFDDNATDVLPTMTGTVGSPRPYVRCTVTVAIVKSITSISMAYKAALESNTFLGEIQIFPDVGSQAWGSNPGLSGAGATFSVHNTWLESIREMRFDGTQATLVITLRGYYSTNMNAFQ